MAWIFGDGFDCYASTNDMSLGYWDSGAVNNVNFSVTAGRFTGSQCLQWGNNAPVPLVKSSGQNDAVHHLVLAFRQTATLTGTTLGLYFQLSDAATNQCCIVFRSDGTILLTSATPAGTVLATYSGAVTAANTWFAFEFEVIISNTVGRFRARKNGNTADDFDSGATLNTRPGANSYANKLSIAENTTVSWQQIDDFLWRSDASSVPFVGDIRCYTRMPASDVSTQFSRAPATNTQTQAGGSTVAVAAGTARYTPFTAAFDGAIGSATVSLTVGYTGNMKCSIFASSGTAPTIVLGSATSIANPAAGVNTFTFGTPVAVTKGTQYWVGWDSDVSSGTWSSTGVASVTSATPYASFPVASPTVTASQAFIQSSIVVTIGSNATLVSEAQQDGATSYVYDSTVNDADFYSIAPLSGTPSSTIAVITRGFVQKSDAGTRNGAVQLKSGATTVQSVSTALSTSWGWLWRVDTTDPATPGVAWTPAGVNNVQVGPVVTV